MRVHRVLPLLAMLVSGAPDRRVVDTVEVGDPASEAMHGFADHESAATRANGVTSRRTRGWMRYAMHVFDDTEVTVEMTFVPDSVPRHFDVVVEDSVIARRTLAAHTRKSNVEVEVPFTLTKGKASIAVVLRARDGVTPALRRIRTVQEHNEL